MKTRILITLLALGAQLLAAPADYNAVSGYGSRITGGAPTRPIIVNPFRGLDGPFYDAEESEVKMENIALASEVDEGNGSVRLGFTLTLRNAGPGYYEEMFIEWAPVDEEWQGVQVGDAFGFMPDLIPNGTTTRTQPFEVRVPAAVKEAAKTAVLAGKFLRPIGIELFQFTKKAVAVDQATDLQFASHGTGTVPFTERIVFTASTPLLAALQPGQLLLESPYFYTLRDPAASNPALRDVIHSAETQASPKYLGSEFGKSVPPPLIGEVVLVEPQGNGEVWVTVKHVGFDKVMDTGTIFQRAIDALDLPPSMSGITLRDIYRPPAGDNLLSLYVEPNQVRTTAEDFQYNPGPRDPGRLALYASDQLKFGFRALHIPFNEVKIFNAIKLDGEILLDALNIEIQVKYRYLTPRKITMKVASKAEITLRLSAGAGAGNKNRPLVDKEKDLFNIQLAEILFNIGPFPIEIAPFFKGKVGAIVNAPTNVVIPIHGSVEAGCVMGWDADRPPDDQVYFRPFSKAEPLTASDPMLNDSLALTASAFAEAGIEVQVNRSAGPYAGARVTANFELNPAHNPWWSLDFDFQTAADFRLSILGFNLPTKLGGLVGDAKRLFHKDPGVAVPRGSGLPGGSPPGQFDPVSGGETRWARKAGTFPGAMKVARVAGTAEDVFTITEALLVSPPITRIGAKGDVIWSKGASLVAPQRMAPTADGGLVFATGGQSSLVVWMNGAGSATAARLFQPVDGGNFGQVFYIGAVLAAPGGETYVIGSIAQPNFANDPFIVKYDANHNQAFFKRYETLHTLEEIKDAVLHPSGDLIITGLSDGEVQGGQFPGFAGLSGGLLMRVKPNGDVVWATRTLPGFVFNSVTVAPNGTIYTAGQFRRTVTFDWPCMLVCRFDPATGISDFRGTFGESPANGNPTIPGLNGDEFDNAGLTPFDEARSIEWTPNGLLVAGNTAALPNVNTRAPVVACLTEQMSLRWWSTHEADGADDQIFDLTPTAQGIFTAGTSRGVGAAGNGDTGPALFTKLPLEGRLDFAPSLFQHEKYLVPSVMQVPGYGPILPGIPTPPHGYIGTETMVFAPVAQAHNASTPTVPTFTDVDISYSAPLQKDTTDTALPPSAITLAAETLRTTATLHGIVDALGTANGTARFEWGPLNGGFTNTTSPITIPRTRRNADVDAVLTGLTTGDYYHYRVRFDTGGSTYYGDEQSFHPANTAPIANSDRIFIPLDAPAVLPVLANDTDPDGDPLTITVLGDNSSTALIAPDGKSILFDPIDGQARSYYFRYTITDGTAFSEASITLNVGLERALSSSGEFYALTGDTVPDPTLVNAVWTSFGIPALADNGTLAATASYRIGRKPGTGIYLRDADSEASLYVRSGAQPPAMPGVTFTTFGDPALSPNGALAFTAKLKGRGITPASDDGLWTTLGGGLKRIIAEGGTLPFLGTARIAQIASFSIRDGEILALLTLKPGGDVNATNDSVLIRLKNDGTGAILAREGSAVSTTDPALISRISALMPALGSNGHARTHGDGGFISKLTTASPKREKLVVFEPDATATTLLTTNTAATPFSGGVRWDKFGLPAIDPTGTAWAAHSTLKLGGTTSLTDTVLLFHDGTANPLTVIAQENDPAPNTTAAFASFLDPLVNADRHIAFTATLRGTGVTRTNATGLWAGPPGDPALIVRADGPALGTYGQQLPDLKWKAFTTQALPGLGGGPIFLATLTGPGVTAANRTALMAQDSTGVIRQVLRTGQALGGRTLAGMALLTSGNGPFDASRSFNTRGAIALRVTFTDRTQALLRCDVP